MGAIVNPIGFIELGDQIAIDTPDADAMAKADPRACPYRGKEVSSKRGPITAPCAMLAVECGRTVGVGETVCRMCCCHGAATTDNPYLRRQIVHVGFTSTVAGSQATEPKVPSDAEITLAIENIRAYCGVEIAKRFVDTLFWNESITQEKADDLVKTLTIIERAE